MKPRLLLANLI